MLLTLATIKGVVYESNGLGSEILAVVAVGSSSQLEVGFPVQGGAT